MSEELSREIEEGLSKIFDNYTSIDEMEVLLPSKGKGYNLSTENDSVTVKSLKFEDELSLGSVKKTEYTNALLSRCVQGIKVQDLFLFDKIFILLKLREISVNSNYEINISCEECTEEFTVKFSLDKFPVKYVDENFDGTLEITLPKIQKQCVLRLPRVRDEKILTSKDLGSHLYKYVESIGEITDSKVIREAIPKLPLVDSSVITANLINPPFGMETDFEFNCHKCGHSEIMRMPLSNDFFTLNSTH